jgi:hypothetical protein
MPPNPLALSAAQLDSIYRAAAPLDVRDRDGFLRVIAAELRDRELGDGLVARVCADVQERFRRPRDLTRTVGTSLARSLVHLVRPRYAPCVGPRATRRLSP